MPEFQSSPSRRMRTDNNIQNDFIEPDLSIIVQNMDMDTDEKRRHQIQLEKKRQRSRSSRLNETEEDRLIRLEKEKERIRSNRTNETEEKRRKRLEQETERIRSNRINETEEQRQKRLEEQKRLSKTNRIKKRSEKQSNQHTDAGENDPETLSSMIQSWPRPIPRQLKETCLQEFLKRMSMSKLAEVCCAVCNIRTAATESKTIPRLRIPNIRLLKVTEELKDCLQRLNESEKILTNHNTETLENDQCNNACSLCNFTFSYICVF